MTFTVLVVMNNNIIIYYIYYMNNLISGNRGGNYNDYSRTFITVGFIWIFVHQLKDLLINYCAEINKKSYT